jgi:ribosome biogenesis protein YTM1
VSRGVDDSAVLLTGSHDMTAKLVRVSLASPNEASGTVTPLAALHLHTAPISGVAAAASGERLLTASWDMLIGVWDATIPDQDEVQVEDGSERKKRRKVAREEQVRRKAPLTVMKSHTARVSKAVFGNGGDATAYSCGFDSTVRTWDVKNGICTNTIVSKENIIALVPISLTTCPRPRPRSPCWTWR